MMLLKEMFLWGHDQDLRNDLQMCIKKVQTNLVKIMTKPKSNVSE